MTDYSKLHIFNLKSQKLNINENVADRNVLHIFTVVTEIQFTSSGQFWSTILFNNKFNKREDAW